MKIGVVLVTYNRIELLKKTLKLYEEQSLKPYYIVVVNNSSTDGTTDYLEEWCEQEKDIKHVVINLDQNIGGSGGFYNGLKKSLELDAEWIWIADDDAFPAVDCFEKLNKSILKYAKDDSNVVSICAKIINGERIDTGHRCRIRRGIFEGLSTEIPEKEYKREYFDLDLFSYVGIAIKKETLHEAGLPCKDMFIYGDDYEHSIRVRKCGRIICVPDIIVYHKTNNSKINELSWRDYYETRNSVWLTKKHFGKVAFLIRCLMRIGTAIRSGNLQKLKIYCIGIKDAASDHLGIHPVYRPGWKPEDKKSAD